MLIEVKQQAKKTQYDIDLNKLQYHETAGILQEVQDSLAAVADINTQMTTQNATMANLISKQVNEVDVQGPNSDLLTMQNEADDIREILDTATDDLLYNDIAGEMLKDTGIRTKIIKEYLPAMNTLINKYLQVLEFFVAFHLDENFQETIKSRHRDSFVYDNFSEGEKMRIDLSLLFAWRQIAKMKNSTNTNLLLLDETFDSSLDEEGVDNLMKILLTLEDGTNTFIISHKPDMLEGKLKEKLVFTKRNNFSEIS
jgi:DNA repair exonuclease SbcCD ATPase subunit